ncbi:hypothetical protein HMPREF9005_0199 [Actinomyces sp. oral taxon 178 str. F0338]|nr:hypothetical protein HMPREF9005_0199 [Actinomyces sp. oral taxon 178 str. F0338]
MTWRLLRGPWAVAVFQERRAPVGGAYEDEHSPATADQSRPGA